MKYVSKAMALVRQCLPLNAPGMLPGVRSHEPLAVELDGTVMIARAGADQIEASIAGRIRAQGLTGTAPEDDDTDHGAAPHRGRSRTGARVEARSRSSAALAEAEPFVWLQLFDDRGISLTHEAFLGRGVGVEYEVHARIELPTLSGFHPAAGADDSIAPRDSHARLRLASGVHARLVTRTYRNPSGPRYHVEVLALALLAAGAELAVPATRRRTLHAAVEVRPNLVPGAARLTPLWAGTES